MREALAEEPLDLGEGELLEEDDEFTGEVAQLPGIKAFQDELLQRKIDELQLKLDNRVRETERLVEIAKGRGRVEARCEIDDMKGAVREAEDKLSMAVNALEVVEGKYEILADSVSERLVPDIVRLETRIKDEERKWVWYLECIKFFLNLAGNGRVEGLTVTQGNIVRCIRDWVKAPPLPVYRPKPDGTPQEFLMELFNVSDQVGGGRPPKPDVDIQEIDRSKFMSHVIKGMGSQDEMWKTIKAGCPSETNTLTAAEMLKKGEDLTYDDVANNFVGVPAAPAPTDGSDHPTPKFKRTGRLGSIGGGTGDL